MTRLNKLSHSSRRTTYEFILHWWPYQGDGTALTFISWHGSWEAPEHHQNHRWLSRSVPQ